MTEQMNAKLNAKQTVFRRLWGRGHTAPVSPELPLGAAANIFLPIGRVYTQRFAYGTGDLQVQACPQSGRYL